MDIIKQFIYPRKFEPRNLFICISNFFFQGESGESGKDGIPGPEGVKVTRNYLTQYPDRYNMIECLLL